MVLPQVLTYCGGVRPKIKNVMFRLNLQDLHVSYNPYQSFTKPLNVIKKEIDKDKGKPLPAV